MTPVDRRSFWNITTEVIHFYTLVIEWATETGDLHWITQIQTGYCVWPGIRIYVFYEITPRSQIILINSFQWFCSKRHDSSSLVFLYLLPWRSYSSLFIHPALSNVYAFFYHVSSLCTPHPPQLLLYCSVTFREAHRIEQIEDKFCYYLPVKPEGSY